MKLKIATCNMWGLPWPFSVHKKRRLNRLTEIITKEQLDIVCLQEIWINRDDAFLRGNLSSYHFFSSLDIGYNPSGLVVVSRFPLSNTLYVPYDNTLFHKEFPSKKGVLRADVAIGGKAIELLNTHLYYSRSAKQQKNQQRQLDALIEILGTHPTILLGDFNVHYDKLHLPPHFHMLTDPNLTSIDRNSLYAKKRFNAFLPSDHSPDMIFANFPISISRSYTISDPLISDHMPVIAEVVMPRSNAKG